MEELKKTISKSVVSGVSLLTLIEELPTIDISAIDEMIEKEVFYSDRMLLKEVKERLYLKK